MILRVISKEDNGLVMVEDDTGKEKMQVRNGTVWVGMIALMEVTWVDNSFKLEAVHDLSTKQQAQLSIRQPLSAYRLLFVKGAFITNNSTDNIGLKIITN